MARRIIQQVLSQGARLINPQDIAFQAATALQKKAAQQSVELFGYDFVGLIIKLFIYFVTALAIAKFMEAVIWARGFFVIAANLFGFNIPTSEQVPQTIKDLFNGGVNGIKYWDAIKVVAILILVVEFMRYVEVNQKNGGKPSPLTIGIFLLIGLGLSITTIPELLARFKKTSLGNEALV